jgi:hypothetical protein
LAKKAAPEPGILSPSLEATGVSAKLQGAMAPESSLRGPRRGPLGPTSVTATVAETVFVKLKLVGKAKKKYKQGKKAKVGAAASFTPNGGSTETQTLNLKLKK